MLRMHRMENETQTSSCPTQEHSGKNIWVIDQAWGQHGWILAQLLFCVFLDQGRVDP